MEDGRWRMVDGYLWDSRNTCGGCTSLLFLASGVYTRVGKMLVGVVPGLLDYWTT
jgi:hypothetical protein